jgi:hypothetical protein
MVRPNALFDSLTQIDVGLSDIGQAEAGPTHENKRILAGRWTSTRCECHDCFQ